MSNVKDRRIISSICSVWVEMNSESYEEQFGNALKM